MCSLWLSGVPRIIGGHKSRREKRRSPRPLAFGRGKVIRINRGKNPLRAVLSLQILIRMHVVSINKAPTNIRDRKQSKTNSLHSSIAAKPASQDLVKLGEKKDEDFARLSFDDERCIDH